VYLRGFYAVVTYSLGHADDLENDRIAIGEVLFYGIEAVTTVDQRKTLLFVSQVSSLDSGLVLTRHSQSPDF
jgi:hypothetical protein